MWEYYWGYTSAQVELASADAPFVAYAKRDKPKAGEPGFKSSPEQIRRDYDKWLERKKNRKFSLQSFLNQDTLSNGNSIGEENK